MFKLKPLSKTIRKEYADMIRPDLIKRIMNGRPKKNCGTVKLPPSIIPILIPNPCSASPDYSIINDLLKAEPDELMKLNKSLWKKFRAVYADEEDLKEKIEYIFGYDGVFNTSSKSKSFWLAKRIERKTCPYCNRQYCFTVEKATGRNSKERIVRPSFDHWFLKSKYPLLSLSIHNLIPSCSSCNCSVRGDKEMALNLHVHPYVSYAKEPKSETYFRFRASKKGTERFAWKLNIDRKAGSRIDRTIKTFALDEIYSYHEELEVRDIMMFDARYKGKYLTTLFKKVIKDAGFSLSREEVYRMLFGCELEEDKSLQRPFSKLKHDLLVQIGVIKDK